MFLKTSKRIARRIDSLFWTDWEIRFNNHIAGFHNPRYRFSKDAVAFVHLPKSGGTTLHMLMKNATSCNEFVNVFMHRPVSCVCKPSDYSYITIMRNPIERVWSYYQMALREDPDNPYHRFAIRGLAFFLSHCWESRNMACRYYSAHILKKPNYRTFERAWRNLQQFKYIVDFENMDRGLSELLEKLRMPPSPIPHERNSTYADYNQYEYDLIYRYNYFDMLLFDRWMKRLRNNVNQTNSLE